VELLRSLVEVVARSDVLDGLVDILIAQKTMVSVPSVAVYPTARVGFSPRDSDRGRMSECVSESDALRATWDRPTCWTCPRTASVCCCTCVSFDVSGVLRTTNGDPDPRQTSHEKVESPATLASRAGRGAQRGLESLPGGCSGEMGAVGGRGGGVGAWG